MRRSILYLVLVLVTLGNSFVSRAQPTTMALGDIAFTRYNATGPTDGFSFVVLRTGGLGSGTVIKFTNRGWADAPSTACGTNSWGATVEDEIVLTLSSAVPYGRQIDISGTTATLNQVGGSAGTVTGVALSQSAGGDQIFAYQGTQTGVHTMLAGIHMNFESGLTSATNWDNTTVPSGTQSSKPDCIVNGTHGLFITNAAGNDEVDNARIKASVILSGNPATDRSRINNAANWDISDVTEFPPGRLSGLPVEFTWIKALEKGKNVQVDWGIALEEEMKDYTIERSADGRLYADAGVLAATGKGTYSWTDAQPATGTNYYRIRATEINGTTKYSTVAIVNLSKGGKSISVYPTLVRNSNFNLQINNLPAGNYKLRMVNANGQLTYSQNILHGGGSAVEPVSIPAGMPKGVYRVTMSLGAETTVATIVVQ